MIVLASQSPRRAELLRQYLAPHAAEYVLSYSEVAQGPADLAITIIAERSSDWDWAKWLPHLLIDTAGKRRIALDPAEIEEIVSYAVGHGTLGNAPGINHTALIGHGFGPAELDKIEAALPSAFDIRFVFNQWTLGEEFCTGTLGIPAEKLNDPTFDMLRHLGFSRADIEAANDHVCGTMTLEGAPHLKEEHLSVFDCANPCGKKGKRFLSTDAHIYMMAAAQSFISGAISKTINVPQDYAFQAFSELYELAFRHGLKGCTTFRYNPEAFQGVLVQEKDLAETLYRFTLDDGSVVEFRGNVQTRLKKLDDGVAVDRLRDADVVEALGHVSSGLDQIVEG